MSAILEILSNELEKRGATIYRFAKETGIPYQRIYKWTKGKGAPKAEDAEKIKKWAEIPVEDVPHGTKSKSPMKKDEKPKTLSSKKPDHPLEPALLRIAEGLVELAAAVLEAKNKIGERPITGEDNNALSAFQRLLKGIAAEKSKSDKG